MSVKRKKTTPKKKTPKGMAIMISVGTVPIKKKPPTKKRVKR
jgi:hypothetical protein